MSTPQLPPSFAPPAGPNPTNPVNVLGYDPVANLYRPFVVDTNGYLQIEALSLGSGLTNLSIVNLGSGSTTVPANSMREMLVISNPSPTINMGVRFTPGALGSASVGVGGTMLLTGGAQYTFPSNYVYTGEFTVCGTSGVGATIYEGAVAS